MAPSQFNHAKVKREAHKFSRRDTRFNPFNRFNWDSGDRSRTFPRDIETGHAPVAAREDDEQETGSPVTHTATAPAEYHERNAPLFNDAASDSRRETNLRSEGQASDETYVDSQPAKDEPSNLVDRRKNKSASIKNESAEEPDDSAKKKKKKDHKFIKHIEPKTPFTWKNQLQRSLLNSWINVLLVAAPVGIALNYTPVNRIAVFVVNFIAIVPLAAMLSFATEEIALRTGETLGGLLNATFGNAVELIVAIMALVNHEVVIVQTSLIGSILSNLLLVMGMCFFFGGLRRQEQFFNTTVAQTAASLLALAVAGVIVPTVFDAASITSVDDVAMLSRGTAIILLFVYGAYLYFQLKTHHAVFSEESKKVPMRPSKHAKNFKQGLMNPVGMMAQAHVLNHDGDTQVADRLNNGPPDEDDEDDPQLHFFVAIGLLVGSTVLIAFCAEYLVDSIEYVTTVGHISKEFLGLILLPIVGNAAEHATAVTVAIKDKMDLAIGVAVGSSMQVALFLIPLLVVIGWGMGEPDMNLSFDIFQVAVMFVSVLLVNYLIADGKSHWLEGMLLMCLYCIIAVCSWWYPTNQGSSSE